MSKPAQAPAAAGILPRRWTAAIGRSVERRISLRRWDALNHYIVQTRLIFSRSVMTMLAALFAVFSWFTLAKEIHDMEQVYDVLLIQTCGLAILLHYGLWESERVGRTFELLIMRVPSVDRLIWFKLRVSLLWTVVLSLPFYFGFVWFSSLPWRAAAMFLFFIATSALFTVFLTCIVSSFIHHGLTAGIATAFLIFMIIGFTRSVPLPYGHLYKFFICPLEKRFTDLSMYEFWKFIIINRVIALTVAAGLYFWFRHRLLKLEKWIV